MRALFLVLLALAWSKHHELHTRLFTREFDMSKENLDELWTLWKQEYHQKYERLEDEERFRIFSNNLEMIIEHNSGNSTFTMGLNQFAAMTNQEFAETYAHCVTNSSIPSEKTMNFNPIDALQNPSSVDWSAKGVVTPVKNQRSCGSCWAFSATGCIESRSKIAHPLEPLYSLSEQQLVDCSSRYGNHGCKGGLMDDAFRYVKAVGGLCSETEYPYVAKTEAVCEVSRCAHKYDAIKSFVDVPRDNELALETAVVAGPVSIAIEADQSSFQHYRDGVLTAPCGTRLDHGVLVVGYGVSVSGVKYWKVKNSWGSTWGEAGYVLLCRDCHKDGGQGECGILDQPSYVEV